MLPAVAIAELAAALTLCAPAGMTLEAREEWLRVAYMTLADVPADLFVDAARTARLSCKHPAQVVPTIAACVAERQAARRRLRELDVMRARVAEMAPPERAHWRPTPDELAAVKAEIRAAVEGQRG